MRRLVPGFFRLRGLWGSWSLLNKFTVIGTFMTIVALVFAVFAYFVPNPSFERESIDDTVDSRVEQVTIPIRIRNELAFDVHVDPGLKYFLLSPKTPLADHRVESGIVRLKQPFGSTAINGNYAVAPYDEMLTQFTLPKSKIIDEAFISGGYKLRVVVTNLWVDSYSESVDVLFDGKTLNDGIRLTFYKTPTSRE